MGPLYGLPRGDPAGRRARTSSTASSTPTTATRSAQLVAGRARARHAVRDRPARRRCPTAALRWLHARARAVRGADGRTERITGLLSDVTERRQREEAHAFLDAASQVLAASLDPVETLEEVARLAVPALADWCAVQLAPTTGTQVAVAHVDPEKVRWARELQDRYPPDPDAPTGAPAVIRSGRSELYPVIDTRAARGRRARRGADRSSCASCRCTR